jgi:hypothetical protein
VLSQATMGKCKASELDMSNSGSLMGPAARRPAPWPLSGAGSARLPFQANGNPSTQGPVVKFTASMGDQRLTAQLH